jgi:hypothetical protein
MADETWNQVGVTVRQLTSVVAAAEDADADSVLLRTVKGASDPLRSRSGCSRKRQMAWSG